MFVPEGKVAAGKLAQALAYGARTLLVNGDFDACLALAREASERLGIALLNSINPWRIEGQKTIVWELLQQLGWEPPDWIVVPAGNLGNTSAFGKALEEARALGLHPPRAAPRRGPGAGREPLLPELPRRLRAALPGARPRPWPRRSASATRRATIAPCARSARTRGVVTAVTDREILDAKAVIDAAGIGCEPASAAAVAGVRRLVGERVIRPGESVVGRAHRPPAQGPRGR